jgi:hypothetical protein
LATRKLPSVSTTQQFAFDALEWATPALWQKHLSATGQFAESKKREFLRRPSFLRVK